MQDIPHDLKKSNASKLEAIASAAVRCAEKVQASLLVVFTHTGLSAQLVVSRGHK